MAFWSAAYNGADGKDPKRGFKFKIIMNGMSGEQIVWFAKKVSKPGFEVTETAHSFSDKEYYFPGRVKWQTVSMTLVDPVSPIDAVAQTNRIIQDSGYTITEGPDQDLVTMSKQKATGALGACQIVQLDSEGKDLETWNLHNPFIKNVKYGELSYESDDLVEIELEIRYDWAQCDVTTGTSAGTTFFKSP
jgi:hypothetical protein